MVLRCQYNSYWWVMGNMQCVVCNEEGYNFPLTRHL